MDRGKNIIICRWPYDQYKQYVFNAILSTHNPEDIELAIKSNPEVFPYDMEQFWFCVTGIKKTIYSGVYNLSVTEYINILVEIERLIEEISVREKWTALTFRVWKQDEKQVAMLLSPQPDSVCSVLELAEKINIQIQALYEERIFGNDRRYCNLTALSKELHGAGEIYNGYLQAKKLNDLSFFFDRSAAITQESIERSKQFFDYSMVMDDCFALRAALDKGDAEYVEKLFSILFLKKIRGTYSFSLCQDALSFIKSMLVIRLSVYEQEHICDLEMLCRIEQYHVIGELVDALLPVLRSLCAVVKEHGGYSKPVLNALYYLRKHHDHDVSLAELAEYANVNASYLSDRFNEETGESIVRCLGKIRMAEAKKLLENPSIRVIDIAKKVGFCDVRYFTQVFKRHVGCTPTAYRKKSRNY